MTDADVADAISVALQVLDDSRFRNAYDVLREHRDELNANRAAPPVERDVNVELPHERILALRHECETSPEEVVHFTQAEFLILCDMALLSRPAAKGKAPDGVGVAANNPITLGDIWIGETCPTPESLAQALGAVPAGAVDERDAAADVEHALMVVEDIQSHAMAGAPILLDGADVACLLRVIRSHSGGEK